MQIKPIHLVGVQFTAFVNNNYSTLTEGYKEENSDEITFPVYCYINFMDTLDEISKNESFQKVTEWGMQNTIEDVSKAIKVK
jgi:hypothetical protein